MFPTLRRRPNEPWSVPFATMQSGAVLVLTCLFMGVCTYGVGTLPLAFQLSRHSLRKLELWGAGLLLGAALTVVIPEGIQNVYAARVDGGQHMLAPKDLVAFCLLGGFLLMLVVEQHMMARSAQLTASPSASILSNMPSEATVQWDPRMDDAVPWYSVLSGLLGILVHAAADGVAMGSSVESSDVSLRVVVILAILVHKAPASVGICTLLMTRQSSKNHIRLAVLVFAVTTPVFALLTYAILQGLLTATGSTGAVIGSREIGAILSFSGGTFLFVAIHAVMELASPPVSQHTHTGQHHPHDEDHPIHAQVETHLVTPLLPGFLSEHDVATYSSTRSLAYVVVGSIVPRLLQLLVGHHHHS